MEGLSGEKAVQSNLGNEWLLETSFLRLLSVFALRDTMQEGRMHELQRCNEVTVKQRVTGLVQGINK